MSIRSKIRSANERFLPGKLFHKPEWLVLGVNNICNLHCKMCDVGTKTNDTNFAVNLTGTRPLNMPIELFRRIIDQAADYCPQVKVGFAFTEPLIWPHLEEALQYASARNIFTSITTNALLLDRKADMLVNSGCNEINISLDGPEAIHNEIRGHKSSYQRAIAGIEKVLSMKKHPPVSVFCVVTEWNTGHLKAFVDGFKGLKIKHLGILHTNFTTTDMADAHNLVYGMKYPATASNVEESEVRNIDLEVLADEIRKIKAGKYSFPVSFFPDLSDMKSLKTFYLHPEQRIGARCTDIFRNLMIKSDGTAIPAHGRCYNYSVGNIYQTSLADVWNSEKFRTFRRDLTQARGLLPACSRCCSAF